MRNQNGIHHNGRKPFKILADEYVKTKIDKIGGQGDSENLKTKKTDEKSFSSLMGQFITEKGAEDDKIVAITAAMCEATGLGAFKKDFPDRLFDAFCRELPRAVFRCGHCGGACGYIFRRTCKGRHETSCMHIFIIFAKII